MKKKILIVAGIIVTLILAFIIGVCSRKNASLTGNSNDDNFNNGNSSNDNSNDDNYNNDISYVSVSMSEAKEFFQTEGDYVIVDVRREDEYADGHIPGAINIPNETLDKEPEELPDKGQVIYVYCRSGNRSKQASKKLVGMGYTSIVEFGGIIDWTGDIEK